MPRSSSPNSLKRWQLIGIIVGVLASVVTLCRFGIPPLIDLAMHERDKEMANLQAEVRGLKEVVELSVQATQKRFEDNEKHTGYLRESVAAIRAELRVRFNTHDSISMRTDTAAKRLAHSATSAPVQLPSIPIGVGASSPLSPDELQRLAARTDRSVEESNKSIPQGKPLEKVRLF